MEESWIVKETWENLLPTQPMLGTPQPPPPDMTVGQLTWLLENHQSLGGTHMTLVSSSNPSLYRPQLKAGFPKQRPPQATSSPLTLYGQHQSDQGRDMKQLDIEPYCTTHIS